jgi:hypothetical protein
VKEIIEILKELNKSHPTYSFGRHVAMAFADYGDTWGLSKKECLFAMKKYSEELELDQEDTIASPDYMAKLYKDVENFKNILDEDGQ